MFGINGFEMMILILVVLIVVGPQRLPEYAEKFKNLVKMVKHKADEAKASVKDDFGPEFDDVDWQKLDPRQYDPRRIVREALMEEQAGARTSRRAVTSGSGARTTTSSPTTTATLTTPVERHAAQMALRDTDRPAPFDTEAT